MTDLSQLKRGTASYRDPGNCDQQADGKVSWGSDYIIGPASSNFGRSRKQ
jgi:hypothetical protein